MRRTMLLLAVLAATLATGGAASAEEAPRATPYVVGGTDASGARYPWQVLITANGNEFCGGTLIHPRIVLTAAHCLVDENKNYFEDIVGVEFRAFAGRTSLLSGGEELDWKISRIDPEYDPATAEYDWGFISLDSPATTSPLQIAGPGEQPLWKAGRKATVTGFGDLSEGGAGAATLQQLTMPILPDSGCANYGEIFLTSTMLCAGFPAGGKDACQGDSGGPLSVLADHGERRLVGVVSTGTGCARPGFPGIYSRVADPVLGDRIQQEVEEIERMDGFGSADTGVDVIGSGATPLGCAAAVKARKVAQQRVRSKGRRLKVARRSGKRNRIAAAKRRLAGAKRALGKSRTKSRKACF